VNKILLLIAFTFLAFNLSCKKDPTSSKNTSPIASFTITPESGGTTATTFTFDASGSTDNEDATTALQVRWDWNNDGTYDTDFSTTKTATHKYADVGNYTIELEVKDGGGLTHKTTKQLIVASSNTAPTASFTVNPITGTIETTFTFDASGCTDIEDEITELQVIWDWENDGTWDTNYSTTKTATHQYTTEGTYILNLKVKDSGGLTNTTTRPVIVSNDGIEGTVTDIDGNVYNTIQIGNQWWIAENLKVMHYRNGEVIQNVTDNTQWYNLSTGAYCSYENSVSNISIYGVLYNWYSVDDSRGLAPEGWHIPTDEEWKELEMYLGGANEGGRLKEAGTTHWEIPNRGATNSSGFTALPGGFRDSGNEPFFHMVGYLADFWSSTEFNSYSAWSRRLHFYHSDVMRGSSYKRNGFSVRCIRD
jgi:uncharacterized protein (TIGR02145 family)